jgi:hypothetical protein
MTVATRRTRSRVPPHHFEPDEQLGAESYVPQARRCLPRRWWCRRCGLLGEPGDARHPVGALPPPEPDPVLAQAARQRDQAVLGEREDADDG